MLGGKIDREDRIVGTEESREHSRGPSGSEAPHPDWRLLRGSQLTHFVERDGHSLGMQKEVVLREEPGEEHSVPLLVSALGYEVLDLLTAVAAHLVAEMTTACPKNLPQMALFGGC